MFAPILALAVISVASSLSAIAAEPPNKGVKIITHIDKEFGTFLANNCTEPRKSLCAAMTGFHSGGVPRTASLAQPYYLGRLHSLRADFKYSMDHPYQSALLILRSSKSGTEARFEQLQADSPDEEKQINEAKEQLRKKKGIGNSALHGYLKKLASQGGFSKCGTVVNTTLCTNENSKFPLLLIRESSGNFYTVALGVMPFMKGSFDSAPGLFISEYVLH
ncbi:MAG: hypothetical protein BWY57_01481 [Betaproteobacteria bacterium ADurb.Bin341]|nr:MAG: hypothetical protein BWY57_01481 [Betaproteobacteria bacterium ADurb.Bin341]